MKNYLSVAITAFFLFFTVFLLWVTIPNLLPIIAALILVTFGIKYMVKLK